ncbi:hypothetical protein AALP_AA1G202500 [Arabis alpina]|uniref:DUF1204 domain-containing protein n=1 Tax=Arabis alpina TaxID=50452 RepID=A0A087HPF4_ARAAL|nr:hypothetical protein AALP_AA1G202500 [Arabis alpina]
MTARPVSLQSSSTRDSNMDVLGSSEELGGCDLLMFLRMQVSSELKEAAEMARKIEESEDQELEEQVLPEFVEEVDGGDLAIDRTSVARIPRAPGLSRDLFPGSSDDIASSSSYETIERIRGDDDWSGVDIRISRPHERPWSPPEGFLCMYECYFNHGGMWFPIPKLALEYCEARRVALSQLTCASYRNICAILTMAAELGRSVNLAQLEEMVGIAKSGDCGRFYASMRSGCMILTGIPGLINQCISGDFAIPLAKIGPYTHRPLKDRKQRSSKKQRSEAENMGIEDLDVVVYSVGSASAKAPMPSDARRRDKGVVIETLSKKKVGAAVPTKPAETSKLVGGLEAGRSEKRKDREDDRRHSGSDSKRSKKERRKDKALVVPEGHPRGPVPESDEMVERDEFLAFSVDLTRMVGNVNFMRTRYEGMLQKNHELIMENRGLRSRMKNMTIAAEEKVGRILALEQENEELMVEAAKWEDEVQSMIEEKESIYHLAKSQMKRLRVSRSDTTTNFGEYAIEKVGTELREKVEAKFEKIRRHIADSKKMNHISSTVGQIKAFLSFYEEQGSAPEGAVERLQEDMEKYLKMVAAHDVEKISEKDFTFHDRASWIPGEELVFPIETPNKIGQYGLGEEWDSSGEEEVRGGGEVDPRSSRVTLRVGGSDPIVSLRGRESGNGSGSSHASETDEDEGPLGVDGLAKNVEHPQEVAGASTRAAEGTSMAADPAGGPVVTPEVPGIDDIDVVNF